MGATWALIAGLATGVAGAVPPAVLFERAHRGARSASVAAGLASIMVSYAVLAGALLVVRLASRGDVLAFGCAEAASFLLVWAVEAWRAWRLANGRVRPGERK